MAVQPFTDCCGAGIIYGFKFRSPWMIGETEYTDPEEYLKALHKQHMDMYMNPRSYDRTCYINPRTGSRFKRKGLDEDADWEAWANKFADRHVQQYRERMGTVEEQRELLRNSLTVARTHRYGLAFVILNQHQFNVLHNIMLEEGGHYVGANIPNPNHGRKHLHAYIFTIDRTADTEVAVVGQNKPAVRRSPRRVKPVAA